MSLEQGEGVVGVVAVGVSGDGGVRKVLIEFKETGMMNVCEVNSEVC